MKLSTFILIVCLCHVSAEPFYAQNVRVSLNLQGVKIDEVFKAIEKQSDYEFFYNDKQINNDQIVSINVKDVLISDALKRLLTDKELAYQIIGKHIVLVKQNSFENSLLTKISEERQQLKITGTITDATTKEPIPGVNIIVEGTTIGVSSDNAGNYAIEVPDNNAILVFSFIGYTTQKTGLNG